MNPQFQFDDNATRVWMMVSCALIFFMQTGFAMLEIGLTRSKNSTNVMLRKIADMSFGILAFALIGFGIFTGNFRFFADIDHTMGDYALFLLFQGMFCICSGAIVSGALAERLKFKSYLLIGVLFCSLVYPLFGSWAWSLKPQALTLLATGKSITSQHYAGWLGHLGFIDFAGGAVVHIIGGAFALAGAFVLKPRLGRYSEKGSIFPMRGHNISLTALGTLILWFGWFGFNGGSLWPFQSSIGSVIAVTAVGGSAGAAAPILLECLRGSKINPEHSLAGILAGLVAITPGANGHTLFSAIIIGGIGGLISVWALHFIENKLHVDDPVGASAIHLFPGIWGTISVGFTHGEKFFDAYQIGVQALGVVTAVCWGLGTGFILCFAIDKTLGLRVSRLGEVQGLNQSEHNYAAYDETGGKIPLGQILLAETDLTAAQLNEALMLQYQKGVNLRIGEILVQMQYCTREQIEKAVEFQGIFALDPNKSFELDL